MVEKVKKQRRKRFGIQAVVTALCNGNLAGFSKGQLYTGSLKNLCVPGLNCYSCPGAVGSCPIGALQAVSATPAYAVSMLVVGFLMVVGALIGRVVCGFLCPFGWLQDLLHKLPSKKLSTKKLHFLTWLKYIILVVFVLVLPTVWVNVVGMGNPTFCKYICPQGVLEGALPLAAVDADIRSALGPLFLWKLSLLVSFVVLSVFFYRPFCKWICPLGAIYGIFNHISLYRLTFLPHKCVNCGKCASICKMDVNPTYDPNSAECIRCGDCVAVCPTGALQKPKLPAYKGVELPAEQA